MYDRVRRALIGVAIGALGGLSLLSAATQSLAQETVRMGHFPNITHVQALVAHNMSRHGKGWFEQRLGPDVKIEWYVYNAGPSAMEAIFAKSIDADLCRAEPGDQRLRSLTRPGNSHRGGLGEWRLGAGGA